jgi:hypothetical protein
MTFVILKVLDATMGLRVTGEDETTGLDLSQHSETAYALVGTESGEYLAATGTGSKPAATRSPSDPG